MSAERYDAERRAWPMTRLACVCVGALVTLIVGVATLHIRYESGSAPIPFILTAYALGAATYVVLAYVLNLKRGPEAVVFAAAILTAVALALDVRFQVLFWFVAVPLAGAFAASLPGGRLRAS